MIDAEEIGVVYRLPVSDLQPHPLNPYQVRDDDAMQELASSIQKHGILVPVIARKKEDGFELIAGHRRQHAAQLVGMDSIPVLVLELDDDDAIIQLVDSNIQREGVLPSERAWAYKLRMEAMKHKAGRPLKDEEEKLPKTSANFRSDDELGILAGVSGDTIRNYISLTNLIKPILDMVDDKLISLSPAYVIAALPKDHQEILLDAMECEQVTPSVSQAQRIKKLSMSGGASMANGEKGKGRSQNQRLKLLYLLDYLLENTDETHTVKVDEIIKHFDNYYKIPIEQKTVCSDLHLLDEYGYETQYDGRTRGWRLLDREFETQELQLLIDCVQSSRFITQKKAKELTDKLKKKASRFDRVYLDRRCYVPNRVRSQNDRIFYDLDDLHRAIANDWQVKFKYYYFNQRKEKVYYKKDYVASPYAMLWSDNNYYLLAYESGEMKHFRVDKMDHISIVPQKRTGKEVFSKMDISKRPLRMFNMFSGKEKTVKMRFANYLANVVLDRFGKDAVLAYEDEKHFTFTTVIETSPQFYGWLCGLGKGVRVVSPPEVVEEMGNYVKGIAEMY